MTIPKVKGGAVERAMEARRAVVLLSIALIAPYPEEKDYEEELYKLHQKLKPLRVEIEDLEVMINKVKADE